MPSNRAAAAVSAPGLSAVRQKKAVLRHAPRERPALLAQADLRLGANWAVGGKVGAEVHLLLFEFEFTPRNVYRVADIGLVAGLSASFRFEGRR